MQKRDNIIDVTGSIEQSNIRVLRELRVQVNPLQAVLQINHTVPVYVVHLYSEGRRYIPKLHIWKL